MITNTQISNRSRGFTLMELMLTVAIIAVLSAIAMPLYKSYVVQGFRATAQSDIMALAQAAERFYTRQSPYTYSTGEANSAEAAKALLTGGNFSPREGSEEKRRYDVDFIAGNCDGGTPDVCTTYTIVASPVDGTPVEGDGFFCLDSTGKRTWADSAACDAPKDGTAGWSEK